MSVLQRLSSRQRSMVVVGTGLVACLMLIILAESALRVRAYIKNGFVWGIEKTFTTDPHSGLRVPIAGGEFGSIKINSLGFRSPELADTKSSNTIRLAFLGGSTTFCAEVSSPEMTWPHLVTSGLAERFPNVDFDYINGGVPGYGINSSIQNLTDRIRPLDPDVILIYHATNDLSYNSFQLAVKQGIATKRTEQQLSWLSQYSLLAYLVEKNLLFRAAKRTADSTTDKLKFDPQVLSLPFKNELDELTKASQQVADLVALITFSNQLRRDQTDEEKSNAAQSSLYYMPYMSIDGLLTAFEVYNMSIRDVANANNSLLIESENRIPGDFEHFADSVHFSDAGSRAMAEIVIDALAESPDFRSLVLRRGQKMQETNSVTADVN